jgi:putative DNA primase/helicase
MALLDATRKDRIMQTYQTIEAFKNAMRESGIEPPEHINADGALHRFHITGQKHGSLNGAYKLYLTGHKPAGYFEDFKNGIKATWKADGPVKPLSQAERQQLEADKKTREQQQAQRYEQAAQTAQRLLNQSIPAPGNHPYLIRKNIPAYDLRLLRTWTKRQTIDGKRFENITVQNVLIVPLTDINGKLWNLQAIFPESHTQLGRDKDFLSGGRLSGLFHAIGKTTDEILICEGFATGLTLHISTNFQVFCALSAGNLLKVAQSVRAANPDRKITIAADNDEKTPGNPGLTAARKAALAVDGFLVVPPIAGDFNDYYIQIQEP